MRRVERRAVIKVSPVLCLVGMKEAGLHISRMFQINVLSVEPKENSLKPLQEGIDTAYILNGASYEWKPIGTTDERAPVGLCSSGRISSGTRAFSNSRYQVILDKVTSKRTRVKGSGVK